MDWHQKLDILTRAARYDVSCASSGSRQGTTAGAAALLGSKLPMGICHSFTPDGRCISLLKLLLTNKCRLECAYCVNRSSSDVPRASLSVRQLVELTLAFYRRNYIEGLFLSSGVCSTADGTMEKLLRVVSTLRREHGFGGYIHLKAIPGADRELVRRAAVHVDRVSANLELPTDAALARLAPGKHGTAIRRTMAGLAEGILETRRRPKPLAPAGQSTQLVVGADDTSDRAILTSASGLYSSYGLKRVYYSAFSPVPGGVDRPPTPLAREHRLYQADWLLRFYGFTAGELITGPGGQLDLDLDPKTVWALAHRGRFPVDINTADREELLRVPGLGVRSVARILMARRHHALRMDDLKRLRVTLKRARPFIVCADHRPGNLDHAALRAQLAPAPKQLPLPC